MLINQFAVVLQMLRYQSSKLLLLDDTHFRLVNEQNRVSLFRFRQKDAKTSSKQARGSETKQNKVSLL
jgi:hypothetical protein